MAGAFHTKSRNGVADTLPEPFLEKKNLNKAGRDVGMVGNVIET